MYKERFSVKVLIPNESNPNQVLKYSRFILTHAFNIPMKLIVDCSKGLPIATPPSSVNS
jgi:hypothetical protein